MPPPPPPHAEFDKIVLTKYNNNMEKFKFIFEDSTTALITAENYRDAAILAMANRIRSNKTRKIVGGWASEAGSWTKIAQNQVTFPLAS